MINAFCRNTTEIGITMLSHRDIHITPARVLKIPLTLTFFIFLFLPARAQQPARGDQVKDLQAARQAYTTLSQGYLLVLLPTYHTQLSHLNSSLAASTTEADKRRLQDAITSLTVRRDIEQNELRAAFEARYTLSPVRYILDKDYLPADTAHNNMRLLSPNGTYDPSLSLGNKAYLLAGVIEKNYQGNYKTNLNVMYPDYRRVEAPFPDRIRLYFLVLKNDMDRNVRKLQQKLDKFARKYMG